MPDPKKPTPEKPQRSRSYGSFLLFLTILVAILFVVGRGSLSSERDFTQDEYKLRLYKGEIDRQEIKGANQIEGVLKNGEHFKTKFADVAVLEEKIQQLNAIPGYQRVTEENFRKAVEGGYYTPDSLRLITEYQEHKSPRPSQGSRDTEEESEGTHDRKTRTVSTKVFAEVLAKRESAWVPSSTAHAPPPLPTSSGPYWLEIRDIDDVPTLLTDMEEKGAEIESLAFVTTLDKGTSWSDSGSTLTSILFMFGPWILILAVFFIFMRQMRGQGGAGGVMSFGRSRAQLYTKENHTNITFGDVAGAEEAKDEVREVVEFLKNPGRFTRIGSRIPRGILLVGQPGCGKTLLAKAIAGEAEVPFYSISGSDFVEMFVGVGASRVRDLFKQARENSPCIIFLDEIDAVGRRRGSGMGGGHDEREQTLNAILVEMDGFGTDEGIIVIAATNRPDVLDPALLRPGRFDREVAIDLPDVDGRRAILDVHLKKVKASKDIDTMVVARSTPGYSGADLAATVNEAAIMAVLAKREEVTMEDLEEARDKVRFGRQRKSRKFEEDDRRITAYHEAGHAVVADELDDVDAPHKVTIVPRGRALGSTMMLPEKESYHMQKKRLLGQLAVLFGGRASEEIFCGDISAGASDDIKRATELSRAMVTELGMSDLVGPINYAERRGSDFLGTELMGSRWHSEQTSIQIDQEVQRFLHEAYEKALEIVRNGSDKVERLTQALLLYETINVSEIRSLFDGMAVEALRPEPDPDGEPDEVPATPASEERPTGTDELPGDLSGDPAPSPA